MGSICPEERQQYKIKWLVNAVKLKGYKDSLSVGVCESTKKIAFLRDSTVTLEASDVLVLYDVNVVNGECEERKGCLCSSCRFNETTAASLRASTLSLRDITLEELEKLYQRVAIIEKDLKSYIDSFDWQSPYGSWFNEPTLILSRAKRQKTAGDTATLK